MTKSINIDVRQEGKGLYHAWSKCVGAGRAHEGLRANWLEQLERAVRECGFEYIRFHGLFHDEMFVYHEENGKAVYNWQYIDELFDRMLDIGIRPFVEFGFTPNDLASGTGTQFWWKGNVTPPKSDEGWSELIRNAVQHWVDRYGIDEVRTWYFEVWNEPNLYPFWRGTRSQYFQLYNITVKAVKSIDAQLRVGGPATSNFVPDDRFDGELEDKTKHQTFTTPNIDDANWRPVWVEAFLDYCTLENLPVDFVSTHPYPTDFALDGHGKGRNYSRGVDSTQRDIALLKRIVQESAYPNAEIHLTEWSSSPSPRDHSHDYLPAAAYVVKANLDAADLTDSLSYWTFTDVFEEGGAGSSIFHGGFGMINFQGILKPTYHAYRFLHTLGDVEIARTEDGIVTKSSQTGNVSCVFYNYDTEEVPTAVPVAPVREVAEDVQAKGKPKKIVLSLEGLQPSSRMIIETVDHDNGFALPLWKCMEMPEPPTREQAAALRLASDNTGKTIVQVGEDGCLTVDLHLLPWSIVSIRHI